MITSIFNTFVSWVNQIHVTCVKVLFKLIQTRYDIKPLSLLLFKIEDDYTTKPYCHDAYESWHNKFLTRYYSSGIMTTQNGQMILVVDFFASLQKDFRQGRSRCRKYNFWSSRFKRLIVTHSQINIEKYTLWEVYVRQSCVEIYLYDLDSDPRTDIMDSRRSCGNKSQNYTCSEIWDLYVFTSIKYSIYQYRTKWIGSISSTDFGRVEMSHCVIFELVSKNLEFFHSVADIPARPNIATSLSSVFQYTTIHSARQREREREWKKQKSVYIYIYWKVEILLGR